MWEVDPEKIKDQFKNHFEKLFKKDEECNWSQDLGVTTRITDKEKEDLEKELKEAIWSCGSNKSPGPDGFTVEFFKKFWDLVKIDLLEGYNQFRIYGKIPKGVNAGFITLIPKVQNSIFVKDFRPINLISSVYKVLSKMLANHLKNVLPLSRRSLKIDRSWTGH